MTAPLVSQCAADRHAQPPRQRPAAWPASGRREHASAGWSGHAGQAAHAPIGSGVATHTIGSGVATHKRQPEVLRV